jgi:hypothetical protein
MVRYSIRNFLSRQTADMTFQPIKVVRRRRLDTKRVKRQQQTRRKDNLFQKTREYSLEYGTYAALPTGRPKSLAWQALDAGRDHRPAW